MKKQKKSRKIKKTPFSRLTPAGEKLHELYQRERADLTPPDAANPLGYQMMAALESRMKNKM